MLHSLSIFYSPYSNPQSKKPYEIFPSDNSVTYQIGYKILRPIIEARIDYYIKKHGLEEYLHKIKSKIYKKTNFTFYDIRQGNGKMVVCGQDISVIIYKISNTTTTNIENIINNFPNPENIRLGSHSVPELNYAIDGMQENGERIVTINSGKNHGNYYIKVITNKSNNIQGIKNLLTFNNVIKNYKGTVNTIRCGDTVSIKYTIRNSHGTPILNDLKAHFTVGKGQVPLALELSVINMTSDHTRSAIIPPELLKDFKNQIDLNNIKIIDLQVIN
ncbi:FKBP-type peptidyl-prolyl cis-trans isomerase [Neoehrlichia mikurensis]|uniref:Peptidyl-prolyl cis-trans isomerase n=1 Tax=Neoehrlichia mikurensis TaxID=89586 RepID=A0A9Q9BSE2_9RICK|nr:FKBP-type peptidyl-prolyl cis-trans isomerase [Neoehrlichia mikurensis]QXK91830.1 FKBP-type peptidyl-prolyl cis-trans isomerase [Neoehrlichia mikurensis]QXK93042.1 FKBP-type peptidyl-prolyl cis-trans isomerase [Neoehrlichia mikurensis]QXK93520.1 FKBP-type peptidyl-prolyl cis-trans isomerase [Neoehrlichia mikurensis]UTO55525.1 FKBP-type peptidyl-prolyl cis-trans isomerase [Neoehrlichia mikurensis]UTO56446.1 FKBP-type peptidyl-prolyl cis-trans isomerase [Neoehrlichia mikurensis]